MFEALFGTEGAPPRRECGSIWEDEPSLMWEHIGWNIPIVLIYWGIAAVLILGGRRSRPKILTLAGVFFILCGSTHALNIAYFWTPLYRFEARVQKPLEAISVIIFAYCAIRTRKHWRDPLQHAKALAIQKAIADASTKAFYCVDLHGRFIHCNKAFEELIGWAEMEMVGKHMHTLIHSRYPDGRAYPVENCEIYRAMRDRREIASNGDTFWNRAQRAIRVTWVSTPIYHGFNVIGARVDVEPIEQALANFNAKVDKL